MLAVKGGNVQMGKVPALKCAALLFATAIGGMGCIQIPVSITGLTGSFDPAVTGQEAGDPFPDEEIAIPTGAIDLSQLLEDAQSQAGLDAVDVQAVLVESVLFDADPGSSFDFITEIEIAFVPEPGTGGSRRVLASAMSASGFGDQLELMTDGMFDLLPFVMNADGGNVGNVTLTIRGITPESTQTWVTTVNLVLMLGIGSG